MKHRQFYNNIGFRIGSPILVGVVIYVLILMIFDSVDMIFQNFFSREVGFIILLTYLTFEANRLLVIGLNRHFPSKENIRVRVLAQYFLSLLISIPLISGSLHLYFIYIEGFRTIETELITFNALYLFILLFYHLFYFSMFYLNRQNKLKVEQGMLMKENIEIELQGFKNHINPRLLFESLEVIISELYHDKKEAEHLIDQLSRLYRYILDNRLNDLVSLEKELAAINPIEAIFKAKFQDAFVVQLDSKTTDPKWLLIPGTLPLILEFALSENIITKLMPLSFTIKILKDKIHINYPLNKKLGQANPVAARINSLKKAYAHYHKTGIQLTEKNKQQHIEIPLLEVEEEE